MYKGEKITLVLIAAGILLVAAVQVGIHRGRMLERERIVVLEAENADLREGASELTMEMARRCWPIWEGETTGPSALTARIP